MSQCHGDMATDPATVSATARTSWNARTKERSRARFLIRQRLQASVNASYSASASADEPSNHIECLDVGEASTALVGAAATTKTQGGSIIISSYTTDAIDRAAERDMRLGCLGAVESGSVAKFSLRYMEMHRDVLRRPIPPEDFAAATRRTRIYETCTSRFGSKALNYTDGRRHADAVQAYLSDGRVCVTALQYAALLGEHDVLKALLLGGFDVMPTSAQGSRLGCASSRDVALRVLRRLFIDRLPLTLSAYLVKCVVEMRLWAYGRFVVGGDGDGDGNGRKSEVDPSCQVCGKSGGSIPGSFLSFGGDCNHFYCELPCLWESLLRNLDARCRGDVVRCPVCDASYTVHGGMDCTLRSASISNNGNNHEVPGNALERFRYSLNRYLALPANIGELKVGLRSGTISHRPRNGARRNALHHTWGDACLPAVGITRDVRQDRLWRYASGVTGAEHYVRACLEAGVDVRARNEYGQTPLYMACWGGDAAVVDLLLSWGADPTVDAYGGMSCANAAANNPEVLAALQQHLHTWDTTSNGITYSARAPAPDLKSRLGLDAYIGPLTDYGRQRLKVLIEFQSVYPGAGAFYIDNIFPERVMEALDDLRRSLPVARSDKTLKQEKERLCSERSYFCEAEGALRSALSAAVTSALVGMKLETRELDTEGSMSSHTTSPRSPIVPVFLPHMRFLNYAVSGARLAPHTDLSRVDHSGSGLRSTHTFLLYMTDCAKGGETALLKDLKKSGAPALAKVDPRRGRLFLFPHACPHEGMEVVSAPKVLLRGEAILQFLGDENM